MAKKHSSHVMQAKADAQAKADRSLLATMAAIRATGLGKNQEGDAVKSARSILAIVNSE
jgi:hypothetical protein